jgi:pimeloyl-ACP methyl ester carboxylesterase
MLRYRLEGSGPPLLLIHGWGVTYAIWQSLAPLLLPHFQLIMIELPGLGGSPNVSPHEPYYQVCADAIEEVRQSLNIEQWSVLAYSSGTRAAEAYVKKYPQSVSHAIFLCPTYILEIWALIVRLLDVPHPQMLENWIFSDWRLHSLVRALGFNWQRNNWTSIWKNEISQQPIDILVRSLYEMPEQGRAPFFVPSMPTLFIWSGRDAISERPRHLGPHDVVIPANHSAPMLAAPYVAEVVLPFLLEERIVSISPREAKARRLSLLLSEREQAQSSARRIRGLRRTQRAVERKRGTLFPQRAVGRESKNILAQPTAERKRGKIFPQPTAERKRGKIFPQPTTEQKREDKRIQPMIEQEHEHVLTQRAVKRKQESGRPNKAKTRHRFTLQKPASPQPSKRLIKKQGTR